MFRCQSSWRDLSGLLQSFAIPDFQGSHTRQPLTVPSPWDKESTRPRAHPVLCCGHPRPTGSLFINLRLGPSSQGPNALLVFVLPGLCSCQGQLSAEDLARAWPVTRDVPTGVHEVWAVQAGARGGKRLRMGWESTFYDL